MNPAVQDTPSIADLARCLDCAGPLSSSADCPRCGRPHTVESGILSACRPLSGRNAVAAAFYDGPAWARFRPWERRFLTMVGGRVRARRQILRHLGDRPEARVLEVGIGDGENLDLLPAGWHAYGVDIARTQLEACIARFPELNGRLAHAEAEGLPFPDATFDACYTIGGFNYFSDPEAAVDEMRRVTRPGGVVVVADERPDLKRFGLGHLVGYPAYDAWWMRRIGLPADFVEMVQATQLDPALILSRMSPKARRHPIWMGLGYLLVDPDPAWSQP
jgi:SAM-dependent methyltransferase